MTADKDRAAKRVRQAWIDGVHEYFPDAKPSYTLPWNEMAEWEQKAVRQLTQHVQAILAPLIAQGIQLPREHSGYLICSIWNVLMFQLLGDPKSSYVKHFNELDEWQQKTDIKMFEAIEAIVTEDLQTQK